MIFHYCINDLLEIERELQIQFKDKIVQGQCASILELITCMRTNSFSKLFL